MSVVVFESAGDPWAWAGRHRLPPRSEGDSIAARASGYYVVLEARRHSPDGRTAVATVLIWAHPAVPDRGRSLAELFRARTEVGLAVYPAGAAPESPDVFDYEEPTTAGPRLLFSVQPIPARAGIRQGAGLRAGQPRRHPARAADLRRGAGARFPAGERFLLLPVLLWLVVRAPVSAALDVQPLFSPATFFRPLLGPLSSSAGVLALAGILLTMAGVWLWRRRLPRRWYGVMVGVALLLASPYPDQQPGTRDHASGPRRFRRPVAHLAAHPPGVGLGPDRPSGGALSRRAARRATPGGASSPEWASPSPPPSSACWSGRPGVVAGPAGTPSSGLPRSCW